MAGEVLGGQVAPLIFFPLLMQMLLCLCVQPRDAISLLLWSSLLL